MVAGNYGGIKRYELALKFQLGASDSICLLYPRIGALSYTIVDVVGALHVATFDGAVRTGTLSQLAFSVVVTGWGLWLLNWSATVSCETLLSFDGYLGNWAGRTKYATVRIQIANNAFGIVMPTLSKQNAITLLQE